MSSMRGSPGSRSIWPSRTKLNEPDREEREQRRELEPEVAGREAVQPEPRRGVEPARRRAPDAAPQRPRDPQQRRAHALSCAPRASALTFSRNSASRRRRTRKYSATPIATTVPNANSPRETYWVMRSNDCQKT